MKVDENQAIPDRTRAFERQVRRLQMQRIVMLGVIAWLFATGPATRFRSAATAGLEARAHAATRITSRGLSDLEGLLRVRPAIDPQTVIEDQREAFGTPASEPSLEADRTPALPPAINHAAPQSASNVSAPRFRKPVTLPAAATRHLTSMPSNSHQAKLASRRRYSKAQSQAAANASLAAAGRAIARDVEASLIQLPAESPRTLALAGWPDPAAIASAAVGTASASTAAPPVMLPDASKPGDGSAAPAAPPVPFNAAPVNLKALGYAQAEDGSAQIVLSDGNALYVVNEGQEFLDRFRVIALRPEGVDIEDRLKNETLHLAFGQ